MYMCIDYLFDPLGWWLIGARELSRAKRVVPQFKFLTKRAS